MHVSGVVSDIDIFEDETSRVSLNAGPTSPPPRLYLTFQKNWKETISGLVSGSPMDAVGRIQAIDTSILQYVGLAECEIEATSGRAFQ
jgi:hypothetical protein